MLTNNIWYIFWNFGIIWFIILFFYFKSSWLFLNESFLFRLFCLMSFLNCYFEAIILCIIIVFDFSFVILFTYQIRSSLTYTLLLDLQLNKCLNFFRIKILILKRNLFDNLLLHEVLQWILKQEHCSISKTNSIKMINL